MAYFIPVYYFSMNQSNLPKKLRNWQDAIDLVMQQKEKDQLWEDNSRNGWHQSLLLNLANNWNKEGLEFLDSELAVLRKDQVQNAIVSLTEISERIKMREFNGLDPVTKNEMEKLRSFNAYIKSKPTKVNDPSKDQGFEAAMGFFVWVKSLKNAVEQVNLEDECFFLVKPQS